MASAKRKTLEIQLQRRVKPRRDSSEEPQDVLSAVTSPTPRDERGDTPEQESDLESEDSDNDDSVSL